MEFIDAVRILEISMFFISFLQSAVLPFNVALACILISVLTIAQHTHIVVLLVLRLSFLTPRIIFISEASLSLIVNRMYNITPQFRDIWPDV